MGARGCIVRSVGLGIALLMILSGFPVQVAHDGEVTEKAQGEEGNQVLFFGRIWAYKGLEYLIRAETLITACVPDAKIVIAGQGEDFRRYRGMMAHPENFIVHNEYVSNEKRAGQEARVLRKVRFK